jgi:hypothetical protein
MSEAAPFVKADEQRRFVGRSNASIDDSPGERIDLIVEGDTLRYDVSCNEVDAQYEVIDDVLRIDVQSTTVVACSPEQDAAAFRLGELLSSKPTFTIVGDVLTVQSALGQVELLDASVPHPDDLPPIGPEWRVRLVVVDDTGGFMSMIEPAPMVEFGPSSVQLIFGCRTQQLGATIDLDTRTISLVPAPSVNGFRRTAPPTTWPVPSPTSTTTTLASVPSTLLPPPTTAPPVCDPSVPSELEQGIMPTMVGVLTYDIDIDLLRLRTSDRSGLDMTAPLAPLPS